MAGNHENAGRRESILLAAQSVFNEIGYANATMDAVATAANISKGSLYNYFDSKADLCNQVLEHVIQSVWADNRVYSLEEGSASDKISKMVDYWYDRLDHFRQFGRLVFEFWAGAAREQQSGQLGGTFAEMYSGSQRIVESFLEQGVARGDFRPDIDASVSAALIVAMLDGATVRAILDPGLKLDEEFVEAVKRAVLAALAIENGEVARGAEGSDR